MFSDSDFEIIVAKAIRACILGLVILLALVVATTLGVQWLYNHVSVQVKIDDPIQVEAPSNTGVPTDSRDAETGRR